MQKRRKYSSPAWGVEKLPNEEGKESENEEVLEVLPHQTRMLCAPWWYPNRDYFFAICGYNSGKSFNLVLQAFDLLSRYQGRYVKIGIGGPTITKLEETTVFELKRFFLEHGVSFKTNGKTNTLSCGTVVFQLIGLQQAETVYAHNFSAFLGDELDELKQIEVHDGFVAVQERTRVPFPDGREAFSCFYTTAQGFRGTYQEVEAIKERGDPYYLIHASSYANKFISKRWLERMERIYNDVERRVFLGGEFANLLTGRVYYGYDESKHRLKERPFEPKPSDVVKIGQDLNAGYSRGVAIVKRPWPGPDGVVRPTLFAVQGWSFGQIGHAAKIMRTAFPPNELHWFPDTSGKEILEGYKEEIRSEGIRIFMAGANPSVVDRIFVENKLFEAGQLYLFPNIADLSMALKTRQYDKNGDPMKRKGEGDPSHWCDGFEYVLWKIVAWDPDFRDFYLATRSGRSEAAASNRITGVKESESGNGKKKSFRQRLTLRR